MKPLLILLLLSLCSVGVCEVRLYPEKIGDEIWYIVPDSKVIILNFSELKEVIKNAIIEAMDEEVKRYNRIHTPTINSPLELLLR